jgi:hypothetical protein
MPNPYKLEFHVANSPMGGPKISVKRATKQAVRNLVKKIYKDGFYEHVAVQDNDPLDGHVFPVFAIYDMKIVKDDKAKIVKVPKTETVSEKCRAGKVQNCDLCDDLTCDSNTSPEKPEGPHDETVSERCHRTHFQDCNHCRDYHCGDNTNTAHR